MSNSTSYPFAPRENQVDRYFGEEISDPYQWMEDPNDERLKFWIKAQQAYCEDYLSQIPFRQTLKERYRQLFNYPKLFGLKKAGEYYLFSFNDGLQNQAIIYRQKGLDGKQEVFIDPNKLSEEGTVAITLLSVSDDDRYIAYAYAKAGSDWSEIRIKEIATGRERSDVIPWVKFSDVAWLGDGFYYTRYPAPQTGQEYSAETANSSIYFHRMGSDPVEDQLIYANPEEPNRYHNAVLTDDKKYLILYVRSGTHGFEIYYKDLAAEDSDFAPLFTGFDYKSFVLDHANGSFYVLTDKGATNKHLVKISLDQPQQDHWEIVIPERKDAVMEDVRLVQGKWLVNYLQQATNHLVQFDLQGNREKEIELPALGSAMLASSEKEDKEIFFGFSSFVYPGTVFRYEITSGKLSTFFSPKMDIDAHEYEVKQVFYPSKDGTLISMFVVHKKGLKLDGKNATYLYGYGGFNISITPVFSSSHLLFLERGGVLAMPNLRGGGEYGESWHQAGMLFQKQNVFDDFIAAAEYLIAEKYTSSSHLAIAGGSNGGLLVGACVNQRPELFAVAFPAVGVLDMLRYHKFTVGWGWIPEYGSSEESEEMFRNLLSYSPLHNISSNLSYPSIMVMTADHDDRVVPAHSFKYTAELQASSTSIKPHLIRIETDAGHGAGKPTEKIIEEISDRWAFLLWEVKGKE